jgi:transcriptional regulator with XRE-family HTH domain
MCFIRLFNLFPVENTIILQGVEWDLNKNELVRIIGNNLQQLRTEKGLTQEALAEKAGISTSFYANLERGNRGVSIAVLYDIAACLSVSVDYLLYPKHDAACIRNIELLLRDKPESFILSMERMIRLCTEEFLEKS